MQKEASIDIDRLGLHRSFSDQGGGAGLDKDQ